MKNETLEQGFHLCPCVHISKKTASEYTYAYM